MFLRSKNTKLIRKTKSHFHQTLKVLILVHWNAFWLVGLVNQSKLCYSTSNQITIENFQSWHQGKFVSLDIFNSSPKIVHNHSLKNLNNFVIPSY